MGKLIDVNKWFKDTFPKADLDYPILDNLKAYPHWSTDITGLVTMLSYAESIEAIPKDQYETRLKADMVAMLTEIQLEIEELDTPSNGDAYMTCSDIIQQKINALKENTIE